MNKLDISIGILTWKRLDILRQTLESYRKNGLLNLSDDITIFFQEIGEEEIALAKEFNLKWIGDKTNIGIQNAYRALVKNAKNKFFLFLENDWFLIENEEITRKRILAGISILENAHANAVRYRHRRSPGYPCSIVSKNRKAPHKTPKNDLSFVPSITENPEVLFKEISKSKIDNENYYFVPAQNTYWTNNPCLFKTSFVRELINIDFENSKGEKINKKYKIPYKKISLEEDLGNYWRNTNYITALTPGLFTHLDYIDDFKQRRKYPELLLRLICCFISDSKTRKKLRARYSRI